MRIDSARMQGGELVLTASVPDGSALTPEGMLEILERRLQTAMEADTEWMQQQKEMQADAASAHTSA